MMRSDKPTGIKKFQFFQRQLYVHTEIKRLTFISKTMRKDSPHRDISCSSQSQPSRFDTTFSTSAATKLGAPYKMIIFIVFQNFLISNNETSSRWYVRFVNLFLISTQTVSSLLRNGLPSLSHAFARRTTDSIFTTVIFLLFYISFEFIPT